MNIKAVIVDEMPESCFTCYFAQAIRKGGGQITDYYCVFQYVNTGVSKDTCNMATRPDWCPLVVNSGATIEEIAKHYKESEE
jgi:hypothetical protein